MTAHPRPAIGAPEYRAGGTDLTERRRSGIATGPVVDIAVAPGLDRIQHHPDGSATIGALVTIDTMAMDRGLRASHPALAAAGGALATPQIRRVATVGGSLLQRNRCWYYRNPRLDCLRKSGTGCPAREGDHRYHVVFDRGPCVAPHPSTVGAALLTYDADVLVVPDGRGPDAGHLTRLLTVAELFGDGADGRREHTLSPGELLTEVRLPAAVPGERAAYHRAVARAYAEWPLVEAVVRLVVTEGVVAVVAVAVGGVAPVPLRLPAVESDLLGRPLTVRTVAAAAQHTADGANPLPMTGYKIPLLVGTVRHTLQVAAGLPAE